MIDRISLCSLPHREKGRKGERERGREIENL